MQRDTRSTRFPHGTSLPEFELLNVDGKKLGSEYLKAGRAALVVFSCNHCPYVQGSDALLVETVRRFEKDGLMTVAVNSNDAVQYPDDSYQHMQEKAKKLSLPYPYLYDETQELAKLFDASCTPECYLFDSSHRLVYQGAITDNPREPGARRKNFLAAAIEQVLEGLKAEPDFNHPIGCSIKWKK